MRNQQKRLRYLYLIDTGEVSMRQDIQDKIKLPPDFQVNLSNMGIEDHELEEIAKEIVLRKPNIKDIFLDKNKISDDGAEILAKSFSGLKHLSGLNLQFNAIDARGAAAIFSLTATKPHLIIALHGNRIIDTGAMRAIEDAATREKTKKKF